MGNYSEAVNFEKTIFNSFLKKTGFVYFADKASWMFLLLIIFLGCVGNILTFYVFVRNWKNNKMSAQYVISLAIVDSTYLVTVYGSYVLAYGLPNVLGIKPIKMWPNGPLKTYLYTFFNSFYQTSGYILCAFVIEKTLAVRYPLSAPNRFNMKKRTAVIIFAIIFSNILSLPEKFYGNMTVCEKAISYGWKNIYRAGIPLSLIHI